jgi:hypothetical protein
MENTVINDNSTNGDEEHDKSLSNDNATGCNITIPKNTIDNLESIEIVSIDSETHGHNCTSHMCCGNHVSVGDILVCTWQVQMISSDIPEEADKILKIGTDDFPSCHVG